MRAIEFVTKVEDGTIKIPKKYLDNLQDELRVIILVDEAPKTKPQRKKQFTAVKIKTKGFKFDRDKANTR